MEEAASKNKVFAALKTFSPATGLGLLATILFLAFCQIDAYVVRWWLMLPLAAAGCGLFLWRRKRGSVAESRVCTLGLCLLLALVVLRDVGLSRKLADLFDTVSGYQSQVDHANAELNRFFHGGR